MPIDVGSLRAITFVVFDKSDVDLGKQVRLQVARYAQVSGDIKTLVNEVPRVTVNIKKYRGSHPGHETKHQRGGSGMAR